MSNPRNPFSRAAAAERRASAPSPLDTFASSFSAGFTGQAQQESEQFRLSQVAEIDRRGSQNSGVLNFGISALSSVGELFGMPATPEAESFRNRNFWAGLGSQLVGGAVPYVGWFRLTQTARAASLVDRGTAGVLNFFNKTEIANPIIGGAVREFVRFTPLELTRLGVGFSVFPENTGELLADVGISTVLTSAFGGAGGWLSSAGKTVREASSRVVDAPLGLAPTFELRMAREGSPIIGTQDRDAFIFQRTRDVLNAIPEQAKPVLGRGSARAPRAPYFYSLENTDEGVDNLLRNAFTANNSKAKPENILSRGLDVRLVEAGNDARRLTVQQQEALLQALPFETMEDLASNMVYPRHVTVTNKTQAGRVTKMFDSPAWMRFGPDLALAKEENGLWVIARRVGVAERKGAKTERGVRNQLLRTQEGDAWFIGKTDKPNLFLPKEHQVVEQNVNIWSKMTHAWRQEAFDNAFDRNTDALLRSVSLEDWQAIRTMRKGKGIETLKNGLELKVREEGLFADSQKLQDAAAALWDILAPTAFKEMRNPLYARFNSMLKGTMQFADETAYRYVFGRASARSGTGVVSGAGVTRSTTTDGGNRTIENALAALDSESDRAVFMAISDSADDIQAVLQEYKAQGLVSPQVEAAIEAVQANNREFLEQMIIPAFRSTGVDSQFQFKDGYLLPKFSSGDFFVDVVPQGAVQKGAPVLYRATGKTGAQAQQAAQAILDEAKASGKNWTMTRVRNKVDEYVLNPESDVDSIAQFVQAEMFKNEDVSRVVTRALRALDAKRLAGLRDARPGTPGTLKQRSDLRQLRSEVPTKQELMEAALGHYVRLGRFAGYLTWRNRFGNEMKNWGQAGHQVLERDLQRKAAQWQGIEGDLTRALNKVTGGGASKLSNNLNSILFAWNLGIFNISHALLNVLSPVQTVLPWVSAVQNVSRAEVARLMHFVPETMPDGGVRGMVGTLSPVKVGVRAFQLMRNPDDELKQLLSRGIDDRVLTTQHQEVLIGQGAEAVHTLRETYAQRGTWEGIKETLFYLNNRSEQFSRVIAFNAGYVVGKDVMGLTGDALYRWTKRAVEVTMYGYHVTDRARIFTGPLGSTIGLFKNWQMHFIGQMMDYVGYAKNEGRYGPLLWQQAAGLSIAGLGGTPLVLMANGLVQSYTDNETAYAWLNENLPNAADEIYYGFPALFGASLQSSATLPGTDVMRDVTSFGSVVAYQRGAQIALLAQQMVDYRKATGDNPMANENIRDQAISAFAPRALIRLFAAAEGDYIKSMRTGYPQVQDVGPRTRLMYGLGFNQVDVDRMQTEGRMLWNQRESESNMISAYGQQLSDAWGNGDFQRARRILDDASLHGVPISSVMHSARTRQRREQGDLLSQYSQDDVLRVQGR